MKQELRGDRRRKNREHCSGPLAFKVERIVLFIHGESMKIETGMYRNVREEPGCGHLSLLSKRGEITSPLG